MRTISGTGFGSWWKQQQLHRRRSGLSLGGTVIRFVLLLIIALFFGLPLLWLVLAPTKNEDQLYNLGSISFGSWGRIGEAWDHLLGFNNAAILSWITNSIFYTLSSVILSVIIVVPVGYVLATMRFPGRGLILTLTLITMIVPASALVLPLFLELSLVGLVDTPWAVILPAAFFPFGVYLAFIYYASSLPTDLLSAAKVDGCNEWQLFQQIALPLAVPLLGLLAFLSFNANWNNFFLPFVMLNQDTMYNLPVGLATLAANTPALHPAFAQTDSPMIKGDLALVGLIMSIPVALVFIFAQRFIVSGSLAGSVKE
ncbi:MAG: carbohydrate ABC transporter permease [Chloroflexi bacterium]|nr:carbohydrate ABC transporter permease [Chloroflexota bacterium]